MKKTIVANWKMYGDSASAKAWVDSFRALLPTTNNQQPTTKIIVCPPTPLLATLKTAVADLPISLGGQDCHYEKEGAWTGDISADLLKDIGCEFVIIGHSERRNNYAETNEIVNKKASYAITIGLVPIICIGETAIERANGQTIEVLKKQITESIPKNAIETNFILAYEPIWAIGSGNVPTMDEIKTVHEAILLATSKHISGNRGLASDNILLLYGGSVKAENAKEIMQVQGVSGVLVGGASLKAEEFFKIVTSDL